MRDIKLSEIPELNFAKVFALKGATRNMSAHFLS